MAKKSTYLFIGTTAELIKLIPVIREFNKRKIDFTIVTSGQNDIQFSEYKEFFSRVKIIKAVTPKSKKSSIFSFIIWASRTFFSLLKGMRGHFIGLNKSNSYFIVHGDTVSSLMGSLVASLYGLSLVHIESGLRTYHVFEPFPEEICRFIISRLADVHFCPNEWSVRNLLGTRGEKINTYENTLIEAFWRVAKRRSRNSFVRMILKNPTKFFVLVAHRQEHVLFNRTKTKELIKFILNSIPRDMRCLFLVHDISAGFVQSLEPLIPEEVAENIIKVGRLPYGDFMHLLSKSEFLITDGGSNQEEMYYMGKPCLLLRKHTERIEGLGENIVLSRYGKKTILKFLKYYRKYRRKPVMIEKRPSSIIVDYLFSHDV